MTKIEEIELKIAELEAAKKVQLKKDRGDDLKIVKELCKTHGFTERMLKDSLKTGRNRKTRAELIRGAA